MRTIELNDVRGFILSFIDKIKGEIKSSYDKYESDGDLSVFDNIPNLKRKLEPWDYVLKLFDSEENESLNRRTESKEWIESGCPFDKQFPKYYATDVFGTIGYLKSYFNAYKENNFFVRNMILRKWHRYLSNEKDSKFLINNSDNNLSEGIIAKQRRIRDFIFNEIIVFNNFIEGIETIEKEKERNEAMNRHNNICLEQQLAKQRKIHEEQEKADNIRWKNLSTTNIDEQNKIRKYNNLYIFYFILFIVSVIILALIFPAKL